MRHSARIFKRTWTLCFRIMWHPDITNLVKRNVKMIQTKQQIKQLQARQFRFCSRNFHAIYGLDKIISSWDVSHESYPKQFLCNAVWVCDIGFTNLPVSFRIQSSWSPQRFYLSTLHIWVQVILWARMSQNFRMFYLLF